jgi:hypothetical protein
MLVFHIAWSRYRLVSVKEPISGGGEREIRLRRTSSSR